MFDETPRWRKILFVILFAIPLILAIAWIVYIKATEDAIGAGLGSFLSPIDNTPIVVSLTLFILGYLFFLGIIFYSNIKEAFSSRVVR